VIPDDARSKMTFKPLVLLAAVFLATSWAAAQNDRYEKQALAYAKRILVSQLDSRLPKQAFAQWFKDTVGPYVKIDWEVNDCGEQTGGDTQKGRDIPTCVEARAELSDGRKVVVRVAVGTFKTGISGPAAVYYSVVMDKTEVRDVKKLSDLPAILGGKAS
jgi:hypothetical protein